MRRIELTLGVVEAAERIGLVWERRLVGDVVRVDAVTERQRVTDQRTADGPLADVDHVVLEPPPVRVAREVAAEHAEPAPLSEMRPGPTPPRLQQILDHALEKDPRARYQKVADLRDDLGDGGAEHFAQTVRAIRARCPATTIEILTPDFLRKDGALELVVAAKPDVFNHNLETVPSRYLSVRPGARYFHSIRLLQRVKEIDASIFTKSGIMVGLGEERHEVLQVMDDLRSAEVDFLTIGQYLQPTRKHHAVMRYVPPDEFTGFEKVAYTKGFLMVSASPLTRSSHHAGEDFARLKAARAAAPR